MNRKRNKKKWVLAFIFTIGLAIFLYPNIGKIYAEYSQLQIILDYKRQQADMDEQIKELELEKLQAYNHSLTADEFIYVDPFEEIEKEANQENIPKDKRLGETLGHIEIPKLKIDIPIYKGTTDYILQNGIGLLEKSSLPIGGSSTHAALTGHRGLPQSELFTHLDDLQVGDDFLIHSLAGTLAYEVKTIKTVLPHETETLKIVPGEDLVTLITCTPYMINTHRILVTGTRVPYVPTAEEKDEGNATTVASNNKMVIILIVLGLGVIIAIIIFIIRKKQKSAGEQP